MMLKGHIMNWSVYTSLHEKGMSVSGEERIFSDKKPSFVCFDNLHEKKNMEGGQTTEPH